MDDSRLNHLYVPTTGSDPFPVPVHKHCELTGSIFGGRVRLWQANMWTLICAAGLNPDRKPESHLACHSERHASACQMWFFETIPVVNYVPFAAWGQYFKPIQLCSNRVSRRPNSGEVLTLAMSSELRSCVKVEVAVPSLIIMFSVDVKQF